MPDLILTNSPKVARVDDEDVNRADLHSWYYVEAIDSVVAHVNADGNTQTLQHFVLDVPKGSWIGFRDGDSLNCHKANLYVKNQSAEAQRHPARTRSKSGYRGVTYEKKRKRWIARIVVDGKVRYLGSSYRTPEEAAIAYDRAARKWYGPDAFQNFPK